MKLKMLTSSFIFVILAIAVLAQCVTAEVLYVDSRTGDDMHPGAEEKPLQSLARAAALVNAQTGPGPTTIKVASGRYILDQTVIFKNQRDYTEKNRLTLEAAILPDDPNWLPHLMPVITAQQIRKTSGGGMSGTETYSIKVKLNHVTIRGLKFLGNEAPNNFHNCIERVGSKLDDLLVTQCLFQGNKDGADIYAAVLATGDRFVVDHCVFRDCGGCVVFWDGLEGIAGQGCAMRYCIVDNAYMCGVCTCQTSEDLAFDHNIITNSEYMWLRKPGDTQTYRLRQCVIVNNKHKSGYGVASGAIGETGDEVVFEENGLIKSGTVVLETDEQSRQYLHPKANSVGSQLGAGLFTRRFETNDTEAR